MKVAAIHEWLSTYAGAERVLEQILRVYPGADLFAVCDFLLDTDRRVIGIPKAGTSFIQRLPGARKHYRRYLPLMPIAIEQLDLSGYDLVISSSHAVAKGVITGPNQLHVSYVHSPMRYAWDLQHQYLREAGLDRGLRSWLVRWMLYKLRIWDARTALGVDHFVANSEFIARRIEKVYRRESTVVYPPVDVEYFTPGGSREDYFLTASRMVPYKRMDVIVEAFRLFPRLELRVIGEGPEYRRITKHAPANVKFLGRQPREVVRDNMRAARAFVFAAEEDFGIVPVEAQACGTPVIAFGRGGCRETVVAGRTGLFFDEQTAESLAAAIKRFEEMETEFDKEAIREYARQFSAERFRREFKEFVDRAWRDFQARGLGPRGADQG